MIDFSLLYFGLITTFFGLWYMLLNFSDLYFYLNLDLDLNLDFSQNPLPFFKHWQFLKSLFIGSQNIQCNCVYITLECFKEDLNYYWDNLFFKKDRVLPIVVCGWPLVQHILHYYNTCLITFSQYNYINVYNNSKESEGWWQEVTTQT